jgi:tetratricopeptide (TPR) repeat protein
MNKKSLIFFICIFLISSIVFAEDEISEKDIREALAEVYISAKDYDTSISQYREILENNPKNIKIRIKLADVLSWEKKYDEAIALYDEVLSEQEDSKIRLQKARVLGWARKYDESIKEYKKIVPYSEKIDLEMKIKKAYWDNRVKKVINSYKELSAKTNDNLEVMFDVSQMYSYQSMWEEAIETYNNILGISHNHFRAKEGLEKVKIISENVSLKSGYDYFKTQSTSRDSDIQKHILFNELNIPINYKTDIDLGYDLVKRKFKDFRSVTENNYKIGFSYQDRPDWRGNIFYEVIDCDENIDTEYEYGAKLDFRIFDIGEMSLLYEKERLENNSLVIRGGYYRENYKTRVDVDINKRLKQGIDYIYSDYSDSNYKSETGVDIKYYLSLEPKALYVKYRYCFLDFDKNKSQYFSPQGFSTNTIELNWKHFLNKEEIFFGADDLYYELGYSFFLDSQNIFGNKIIANLVWDINKRLNIKLEGQYTHVNSEIYEDKKVTASINYYF